jgi:response regulator RpfG family c-di-GMP phosphodiesterase
MGAKLKILVVGDRISERDALALAMGDRGYYPRVAAIGELSFAVAQEQPDLVVLDVESAAASDVAGMIRESAVGCPVVVLSDRASAELDAYATRCGAAACFDRTGSPEALTSKVEQFLLRSTEEPRPSERVRERFDYVGLARRSTRDQFVAAWPCPFLVSVSSLVSQAQNKATADILDPEMLQAIQDAMREKTEARQTGRYVTTPRRSSAIALAIRGGADGEAEKISVGRASEVDVFIDHATISKRHAWFLRVPGGFRVSDAGSRNGTWVSGQLLEPNGPPSSIVQSEDSVRFGELEFTFLKSTSAWDVLRVNVR